MLRNAHLKMTSPSGCSCGWFGIYCLSSDSCGPELLCKSGAGSLAPRQGLWKAFWLRGATALTAYGKRVYWVSVTCGGTCLSAGVGPLERALRLSMKTSSLGTQLNFLGTSDSDQFSFVTGLPRHLLDKYFRWQFYRVTSHSLILSYLGAIVWWA